MRLELIDYKKSSMIEMTAACSFSKLKFLAGVCGKSSLFWFQLLKARVSLHYLHQHL